MRTYPIIGSINFGVEHVIFIFINLLVNGQLKRRNKDLVRPPQLRGKIDFTNIQLVPDRVRVRKMPAKSGRTPRPLRRVKVLGEQNFDLLYQGSRFATITVVGEINSDNIFTSSVAVEKIRRSKFDADGVIHGTEITVQVELVFYYIGEFGICSA